MIAEMSGLNEQAVEFIIKHGMTVSAAESCTGGLFAALITEVAGASEIFNESFVTYADRAKAEHLGVKEETLRKYGAVSSETAYEMAEGLYKKTGADIAVSITGIAGPGGGTAEKPVGLVYSGIRINGKTCVLKMNHSGSRNEVREKTCKKVFETIIKELSVL